MDIDYDGIYEEKPVQDELVSLLFDNTPLDLMTSPLFKTKKTKMKATKSSFSSAFASKPPQKKQTQQNSGAVKKTFEDEQEKKPVPKKKEIVTFTLQSAHKSTQDFDVPKSI